MTNIFQRGRSTTKQIIWHINLMRASRHPKHVEYMGVFVTGVYSPKDKKYRNAAHDEPWDFELFPKMFRLTMTYVEVS